jgi:hypothetical protein
MNKPSNVSSKVSVIISILALLLSMYALYTLKGSSMFSLNEGYEQGKEVTFQDYCVANALDQNVLDPSLVEMACKNQDAYLLSAGVQGIM